MQELSMDLFTLPSPLKMILVTHGLLSRSALTMKAYTTLVMLLSTLNLSHPLPSLEERVETSTTSTYTPTLLTM